MSALVLVMAGCNLSEADILPQADVELDPLNAGGVACPGQAILLTWDGGAQLPRCEGREGEISNADLCKNATLTTRPHLFSFLFGILPEHLSGEEQLIMPGSGPLRADYRVTTDPYRRTGTATDSAIVYNADDLDLSYHIWYAITCDPATSTWQWARLSDDSERLPPCAGISRVCNTAPANVSAADGTAASFSEWRTCDDATFRGQRPADLAVEPAYAPDNAVIGQSCTPGQTFAEAFPSREGGSGSYQLAYRVDCMAPEDLADPTASTACSNLTALSTAYEAVTYGEGAPDDMLYEFCNLDSSCGDGFCEPYCEVEDNCPQDCQGAASDEPLCGDGTLSGDEQCEADTDCQQGFSCGQPGSDTACTCLPLSQPEGQPADQPAPGGGVCDGAAQVETYPVYDCSLGTDGYVYYEGMRCWDASGAQLFDGRTSQAHLSETWLPGCPGAPEGGGDGSGGPPSCQQAPNDPNCVP